MKFIQTIMALFMLALTLHAEDFIVVVNKASSVASISKTELKRLYSGKLNELGGAKAQPINLSMDNPAAISFLKSVLDMAVPDYKSFWLAEQVRGGSSAPGVQKTAESMIAYVIGNTAAIGYLPAGTAVDGVKIIPVK